MKKLSIAFIALCLLDCCTLVFFPQQEGWPIARFFLSLPYGVWLACGLKMAILAGFLWTCHALHMRWPVVALTALYSVYLAWNVFALIHNFRGMAP